MTKILVIENERRMRANIIEILEYEGFEAIGAGNGLMGIQLAQRHLPDLIFCNLRMPASSGYDVLVELRKNPLTATIPCIFLTSHIDIHEIQQGLNLKIDGYLTKPFKIKDLLAAIQIQLKRQPAPSKML